MLHSEEHYMHYSKSSVLRCRNVFCTYTIFQFDLACLMNKIPGDGLLVDGAGEIETWSGRLPVAKETEAAGERRLSPSRSLTTPDATCSLSRCVSLLAIFS
jgi:hypothetical protein